MFNFNHGAFDQDGDSLVYRLITPFTAGSQSDPFPLATAPPYQPIDWGPSYGTTNYMDGDPALTINSQTGLLNVRPRQLGQYVFGIAVEEYRNGVRLSETRRDIQINVVPCPINFPPDIIRPTVTGVSGDTLTFIKSQGTCYDFRIEDFNGEGIAEDNLDIQVSGALFDDNIGASYTAGSGISPQNLSICWAPSCEQGALTDNMIIIRAADENNCPSPNVVFDTLYVRVLDGPLITPDLNCISFDTNGNGVLTWDPLGTGEDIDFLSFSVLRDDGSGFQQIASITDATVTSFVDEEVDPNSGLTYCYQLQIEKDCFGPTLGVPSNVICTEDENLSSFCKISAEPGFQGIVLEWSPALVAGFESYRIYRKGATDETYELLVEVADVNILSYQDNEAPIEEGPVCYRLSVVDLCGSELNADEGCSIFATISEENFSVLLDWTSYSGWTNGVDAYEIWSYRPDSTSEVLASLDQSQDFYRDNEVRNAQATYCYRIRAVAPAGECGEAAWSPEVCYKFDPLLYIPTAFSPNGDGRNDRFEVKGAFVPRITLSIYSRWGRTIFQTQSLEQAWDGTFNGGAAPEGVYVYHIVFETPDGQQLSRTGSLVLIR